MNVVLVDTNVVSFLFKGDTRAEAYARLLQGNRLAVSFMTVAELFEWAAVRNWGSSRIAQLEQVLETYLVIPADIELCRTWGTLRAQRKAAGQSMAPQDAWIVATALRHGVPLVTHNPSDSQHIAGLNLQTIV